MTPGVPPSRLPSHAYSKVVSNLIVLATTVLAAGISAVAIAPFIFAYGHARAELFTQLKTFSFHKAECFTESDRTLITKLLTLWHSSDAQDSAAAISAFDNMVRTRLYDLAQKQTGEPLPYTLNAAICVAAYIPTACDVVATRFLVSDSMLVATRGVDHVCYALYIASIVLLFWPAVVRSTFGFGWLTMPKQGASKIEYRLRLALFVVLFEGTSMGVYYLVGPMFYTITSRYGIGVGTAWTCILSGIFLLTVYKGHAVVGTLRRCMRPAPPTVEVDEPYPPTESSTRL